MNKLEKERGEEMKEDGEGCRFRWWNQEDSGKKEIINRSFNHIRSFI